MVTSDELGKMAYETYCEKQQWKSFTGDALPHWEEVRLDIKLAWIASAIAVVEHVRIHGIPHHSQE
jgi:hypothetical protein